jgi:hypothetical protein
VRSFKVNKNIDREVYLLGMKLKPAIAVGAVIFINLMILFFTFSLWSFIYAISSSFIAFLLINTIYEKRLFSKIFDEQLPGQIINDINGRDKAKRS